MNHVVYGADDKYLPPLLVSIYSLARATSERTKITVITTAPPIVDSTSLDRLQVCFPHVEISVRKLQDEGLDEYQRIRTEVWPAASLIPLFIPWVIPDRCLFLDADTVVLHDIAELCRTELNSLPLGACQASSTAISARKYLSVGLHSLIAPRRCRKRAREFMEWKDRPGFTIGELETEYFSSGVLLYDTRMIRKLDPDRTLMDIEASRKHWNSQPDADHINEFFKGRIHHLDLKWNVYRDFLPWNRRFCSPELWSAVESATADPGILHFAGIYRRKPWARPRFKKRMRYVIYEGLCRDLKRDTEIDIFRLFEERSAR